MVARLRRRSVPLSVLGLGLALGVCWAIALASGVSTSVWRHAFYVPVVLGAARFGFGGAVVTSALATLLAGPLAPGGASPEVWLVRGAFFLGVGGLVAALSVATTRATNREGELAERERRLREQRTALIQTVSHEFRTPLTIIHGVSETLLQRQDALDAPLRPLAGALYRAERRLSDMVAVVLAAADVLGDPLQHEPVELEPLVREVADDLGPGVAQRVGVDVVGAGPRVVTSRSHTRLLLRCLLDNAVRFSDPGQPVDVSVTLQEDLARITIRDRGEGMDPAFVERAFEPFTQGDSSTLRRHGGLGLGLYTARQLARRLGGDVEVRPAEGGGSLAIVELPQRREKDRVGVTR